MMKVRFLLVLASLLSLTAAAAPLSWPGLEPTVTAFLKGELAVRAASFKLDRPRSSIQLPECASVVANWPPGASMSGHTFVELSCPDKGWSVRYPVTIEEKRMGLVTTRRIMAGETIAADDIKAAELPSQEQERGVFANPAEVIGKMARSGLSPGVWLRAYMVQAPLAVHTNQPVRVLAGDGVFQVAADGTALNNGAVGDDIAVRMPGGRVVRGTIDAGGNVVVKY
jgi:flagella basal body P-ring formation protein FlgA